MKARGEDKLVPAGETPSQLMKVEEITGLPNLKAGETDSGSRTAWVWIFHTHAIDPETGSPYIGKIFTGDYLSDKTNLGKLMKMMCPGLSIEQLRKVDTDTLLNRWYDICWTVETKDGGGQKNNYLYVKPYVEKAAAPVAPDATPASVIQPDPATAPAAPAVAPSAPSAAPNGTAPVAGPGGNPFTPQPAATAPATAAPVANPFD